MSWALPVRRRTIWYSLPRNDVEARERENVCGYRLGTVAVGVHEVAGLMPRESQAFTYHGVVISVGQENILIR